MPTALQSPQTPYPNPYPLPQSPQVPELLRIAHAPEQQALRIGAAVTLSGLIDAFQAMAAGGNPGSSSAHSGGGDAAAANGSGGGANGAAVGNGCAGVQGGGVEGGAEVGMRELWAGMATHLKRVAGEGSWVIYIYIWMAHGLYVYGWRPT